MANVVLKGVAQKSNDSIVRVYSMNFPEKGVLGFSLKELEYKKEHEWANYPRGTNLIFLYAMIMK